MAEERNGQGVEPIFVWLEFDDGQSMEALVTPLGDGTYRLEETEWMADLYHHDIIQAEDLGASGLRYIRVAQRSELVVSSGIYSDDFLNSTELLSALNWLTRRGGYWQRDMVGILVLSVPKDAKTVFDARWDQAVESYRTPDRRSRSRVQRWARGVGLIPFRAAISIKRRAIYKERD